MKSPKKIPATIKEEEMTTTSIALLDYDDNIIITFDYTMKKDEKLPPVYIHAGRAFQLFHLTLKEVTYREVPCVFTQAYDLISMYEVDDGRIIISNGDDHSNANHHEFYMDKVKITRFRANEEFDIVVETKTKVTTKT